MHNAVNTLLRGNFKEKVQSFRWSCLVFTGEGQTRNRYFLFSEAFSLEDPMSGTFFFFFHSWAPVVATNPHLTDEYGLRQPVLLASLLIHVLVTLFRTRYGL